MQKYYFFQQLNSLCVKKKKIEGLKDNIVLGTAAAVNVPYKGQRFVIEAIADLCKQGDCRYVRSAYVRGGKKKRLTDSSC